MDHYCIENELIAGDYFGKGYLKVPRTILNQLHAKSVLVRQQGQLHLLLFESCFFVDGYVELNGDQVSCRKGEYVGTQAELARLSGIHPSTVNVLLHKMADAKLVTLTRIPGGSRIRVNGYVDFTAVPEEAEAKAKEPTLADQLEAAKRQLGGRQMEQDNPVNEQDGYGDN